MQGWGGFYLMKLDSLTITGPRTKGCYNDEHKKSIGKIIPFC
jgi:hypothetical protein